MIDHLRKILMFQQMLLLKLSEIALVITLRLAITIS